MRPVMKFQEKKGWTRVREDDGEGDDDSKVRTRNKKYNKNNNMRIQEHIYSVHTVIPLHT